MCSALILSGCNKTSQQDQAVSKEQKSTEQKPVSKQNNSCIEINAAIQKINQNSKIEDLNQINEKLKTCVPSLKNDEQLKLINASTTMYQRFLKQDYTDKTARAFESFGYAVLEQKQRDPKKVIQSQKKLFDQLSPRDQYLLQHNGEAYIDLLYQGEGMFTYRRQPNYLVDVFSKALTADQKEFLTRMAKDNQDIFYNDGALAVSWKELTERALFWEKFIQKYPKSHFISDAKLLFNEYRYFIFFGLDNTPVSDEYAPNTWFDKDALQQIHFLSTQSQSSLAKPAQQFLKFIATPVEERNKQFKIDLTEKNGDKKSNYQITHEQLEQLLKFDSLWNTEVYRDCHIDAVCIDTN
ncbi:TolA-binding protein [Acinetobacter calcoaceticus]|uniref:TolA-binding protein n=2 Tax=Acinetobacter calcoaceticus TaxID=471 RepID=A0ABD5ARR4_ACICA|nr:TolA-binding protein [Acinetobacter calcoaceticus]